MYVEDNRNTLRTGGTDDKTGPMPTACWTCKSQMFVKIMNKDGDDEYYTGKWSKIWF